MHPLTGAGDWMEMRGTTKVSKVWDGRGNLAEFNADGPSGHLTLLALRLYNPASHQWNIHFATPDVGATGVPLVGEFKDGRGEFYDAEPYKGRQILVRFTFISLTPDTARSEQAFSDDGGKTWETNWINRYTRMPDPEGNT